MTPLDDPKPLTEEALAEWQAELEAVDAGYVEGKWDGAVLTLISELRSSRARIEELTERVKDAEYVISTLGTELARKKP